MLGLVVLTMGLIVAVGLLGFTFNTFLFQCTRSQYDVDALAVQLANAMNAGDRIGQMNELVEASREIVHVSQKQLEEYPPKELDLLAGLASQLDEEARAGQLAVDRERRNQIYLINHDLQQLAFKHNMSEESARAVCLGWLRARCPQVVRVEAGRIVGVDSNIKCLQVLPELDGYDNARGYLAAGSRLLKGGVNARLAPPNAGLEFKFAAVPAFVGKTCAPVRNVNSDVFQRLGTICDAGSLKAIEMDDIPSAVQIHCTMETTIGAKQEHRADVRLVSTAAAAGAASDGEL